ARKCRPRRTLRLTTRIPADVSVSAIRVFVNGRRAASRAGRRLREPIVLRGLPRRRYTVKVEITLADGRTVTASRRYRTCARLRGSRSP
ncbi:MAG TPA: hypothetical protein VGW10_19740, partial [Solirubrobacteraceae bacterium]|nr:hypothetical protein [Solirubrobacteraceae bacterium]